ncbi:MAG TPA: tyrosine--tRNA ligase, partial [Lactobacillus acetotolerans]|nr:tyrosine--tRNA ligase [Lactobacillus acetotolerans]
PTGDSLHVGHLIPFMILKRFQMAGYHPVILIGEATGSIGDPSGRNSERVLQSAATIDKNKKAITKQMKNLFGTKNFEIVNNMDWLGKMNLLDFLRDYGKLFQVNNMLDKDVVASRLKNGISFTEFSYQILQAVDFYHLNKYNGVQLQIGGG